MQSQNRRVRLLDQPVDLRVGNVRFDVREHRQIMHDVSEGRRFDDENERHAVIFAYNVWMTEPLSVVIITFNVERELPGCLASVGFADEILVIDSGSTDATVEVAKRHGARVMAQPWLGYGPQKQYGVDQARHRWV